MGLIDDIKNDVKKSGTNKGKILYVKEGAKIRVRFLQEMDEGLKITFHDSYSEGVNYPCRENYGKDCPGCEDDSLRTRDMYAWSVYDYEANEVKILLYAVNNCSPVAALVSMYEAYNTMTDRDYIISRTGKGQNTSFSVVPMDKQKFRNSKMKAFSKSKVFEIIDKAFPFEGDEDDSPRKSRDEESSYEDMTAMELYKLCQERKIECEKKKPQKYYIGLLEEYDNAQEDWGDEDEEDDDWEEDEQDYESMKPKELYDLCKEKGIEAKPKKSKDYYIELLTSQDEEWGDEEEDEWED